MSTRGVCGVSGGVAESTRCSVGGRTGVGGARERQSLGRHWRRRRDVMIKERVTAGAVSATGRRIVPHLVHRWPVWRPSVWRRSECAGGVRDIVWRRRRRDTENEICGKKLSSRLRGSRPLVPDGGRRRQPSAFKYTLYLSQSHTYAHAFLFILSRVWFPFALPPPRPPLSRAACPRNSWCGGGPRAKEIDCSTGIAAKNECNGVLAMGGWG